MGMFDSFFGKRREFDDWTATHRGIVSEVSRDEIEILLGRPKKAKGGFLYWRGPMTEVDPDLPESDFFQISNRDYRIAGNSVPPKADRTSWFIVTNSPRSIKILGSELGGLVKGIEQIPNGS